MRARVHAAARGAHGARHLDASAAAAAAGSASRRKPAAHRTRNVGASRSHRLSLRPQELSGHKRCALVLQRRILQLSVLDHHWRGERARCADVRRPEPACACACERSRLGMQEWLLVMVIVVVGLRHKVRSLALCGSVFARDQARRHPCRCSMTVDEEPETSWSPQYIPPDADVSETGWKTCNTCARHASQRTTERTARPLCAGVERAHRRLWV